MRGQLQRTHRPNDWHPARPADPTTIQSAKDSPTIGGRGMHHFDRDMVMCHQFVAGVIPETAPCQAQPARCAARPTTHLGLPNRQPQRNHNRGSPSTHRTGITQPGHPPRQRATTNPAATETPGKIGGRGAQGRHQNDPQAVLGHPGPQSSSASKPSPPTASRTLEPSTAKAGREKRLENDPNRSRTDARKFRPVDACQ